MNAFEWQRRLREQGERHGKWLFRVAELANLAGQQSAAVAVQLVRLQRLGVVSRYAPGLYGLPGAAELADLLPQIDESAYVTGLQALSEHGLVSQVPAVVTCFTDYRRTRQELATVLGRIRLSFVRRPIYHPPELGLLAPPAQALCDFIYMQRRQGRDARGQVTYRHLDQIDAAVLRECLERYPRTVALEIEKLAPSTG